MNSLETITIRRIAKLAKEVLPDYEIRGVFRIIDHNPHIGQKCEYKEMNIEECSNQIIQTIYGGVILACPTQDRTNGKYNLEISTRDHTLRANRNASSKDALLMKEALERIGQVYTFIN